ncbi:dephospho-CoA kinase [Limosilactobacillus coleohominis]|uniref:Dephospho-CoA kinase n=1 Tax=Limosilactobacillus coleohominis TaxID=181675 RepID=A0ABS2GWQ1_9LACO|nr:dephospho-CoA kinase [Limosilactobacillus coleohominis]MBM6940296.1 dephospho-CoA kinase [Limosilactobacillus coleohominis]MBM6955026.1 dephospho-CoA kinase [Limosilactobacillus coleohominis]HJA24170.1 dephospho-CoA kinase [Candidatus Limosilactobacillus intestinavium]
MTMVIGLTGGIATGKTTVSNYLKELGYSIIDADVIARQVVEPGTKGLRMITDTFGEKVLTSDGLLDRQHLAQLVFTSSEQLQQLNRILQPIIRERIQEPISTSKDPVVVIDVPLLYEQHYEDLCDVVMVVSAQPQQQLERLMNRNHLTMDEAKNRVASQMPLSSKERLADVVIDNNGSVEETRQQVKKWLNQVVRP